MNTGKYVFAQVLSVVNRYVYGKCVDRYNWDYRTRGLNCWNQFVQLFFGQLTGRNGIRDICLCSSAHKSQLYHLGIKQNLQVKTLWGHSENAVKTHFCCDPGLSFYWNFLMLALMKDGSLVGKRLYNTKERYLSPLPWN